MKSINGLDEWLDIRKEVEKHNTSWGWIGTRLHLNLQIEVDAELASVLANKWIEDRMS